MLLGEKQDEKNVTCDSSFGNIGMKLSLQQRYMDECMKVQMVQEYPEKQS
jgi:hypothetical protein